MFLRTVISALLLLVPRAVIGAVHFQHPDDLPAVDYDFIIIGGGTAGAVVATRLGENHDSRVLVIEAGPSETQVPGLSYRLANTLVDWNYTLVPQAGINNQSSTYGRARMLGGCSSHNDMVYTRGSRDDYDRWAAVTGDNNLSWEKMLPNILKTEKLTKNNEHQNEENHLDPSVHGRNGKIAVSAGYFVHPFNDLILETTKEMSGEFPFKLDMNDGRPIGIGWGQSTIGDGVRSSAATGYLAPTGNNIHVLLNTLVTRVVPVGGNRSNDFRKVEFATSATGPRKQLTAKKEVILSGGVTNTPQVLLNSGIGSRAELEPLGIQTLVDNPSVGKNFSDQPAVTITFATNLPVTDFNETVALAEWNRSHTGPLSLETHLSPVGWVRLSSDAEIFQGGVADPSAGENSPHIEHFFEIVSAQNNTVPIGRPPDTLAAPPSSSGPDPDIKVQLFVTNLNPAARGSISLSSSNPFSHPKIDPQLLGEPIDIAILREGIRSARRLFSASAWKNKVFDTVAPAANVTTDPQLDAFLRENVVPFLHGVGSAAMSPKGAKWGVVDPDFNVKGTKGLRVVDASVIPYVNAGHTQAAVYAIAERASDVIRSSWE